MNGAQLTVAMLREHGVQHIFGYPGGAIMPVYDALYDGGVDHILCRHEQGAAMAAIGYARASGQIGVCLATSGPGATNLITGLADAYMDSVPIVAITGQVASPLIGTDAFQEIDVLGLSLACTKHSFLVTDPEKLTYTLSKAFQIAKEGRPGPVLVDIAKDVQLSEIAKIPAFTALEEGHFEITTHQLNQAIDMCKAARKPLVYLGGGVQMAKATEALRQFLKATSLPVTSTLKGLGSVQPNYPYNLGMLGMHGTKAANLAVQSCDLLIAVGARFDDRVTGKLDTFAPNAKVIHIDIDAAEFDKLRRPHLTLQGELNPLLIALTKKLSSNPMTHLAPWQNDILSLINEHAWRYDHPGEAIYAPLLLKQLSNECPPRPSSPQTSDNIKCGQPSTSNRIKEKTFSLQQGLAPWGLVYQPLLAQKWHDRMMRWC